MPDNLESRKRRRLAGQYPVPFFVRATEEEAGRIVENARKAGRNHSRFLAELGAHDDAADSLPRRLSAEEVEALVGLATQVRKAGVNLNQLAHRENSADVGGPLEPPSEEEVAAAARAVREAVEKILALLS